MSEGLFNLLAYGIPVTAIIAAGLMLLWQNKKREELMSKKEEEKAMKEALDLFEKELSAELDKIAMSDNPFQALLDMAKEDELDPVKDFSKILTKPKGEHWQ